jgi:hypothetical protein
VVFADWKIKQVMLGAQALTLAYAWASETNTHPVTISLLNIDDYAY